MDPNFDKVVEYLKKSQEIVDKVSCALQEYTQTHSDVMKKGIGHMLIGNVKAAEEEQKKVAEMCDSFCAFIKKECHPETTPLSKPSRHKIDE